MSGPVSSSQLPYFDPFQIKEEPERSPSPIMLAQIPLSEPHSLECQEASSFVQNVIVNAEAEALKQVEGLIQQGEYRKAHLIIKPIWKTNQNSPTSIISNLLARAYIGLGKSLKALDTVRLFEDIVTWNTRARAFADLKREKETFKFITKVRAEADEVSNRYVLVTEAYANVLLGFNKRGLEVVEKVPGVNDFELFAWRTKMLALTGLKRHVEVREDIHDRTFNKPKNLFVLKTKALVDFQRGRYLRVIKTTTKILKDDPEDWQTILMQATALLHLDQPKEALGVLDCILEKKPKNLKAHNLKARAHTELKEFELARKSIDVVFSQSPNNLFAQRTEARLATSELRNHEEAIRLAMICGNDEEDFYDLETIILAKITSKKDSEAKKLIDEFLEKNRTNLYVLKAKVVYLLKEGEHEKAKSIGKEILKLDPKNVFGKLALGRAYIGLREPKLAFEYANDVLQHNLQDLSQLQTISAWLTVAKSFLMLRKPEKACEAVQKALDLEKENKQALKVQEEVSEALKAKASKALKASEASRPQASQGLLLHLELSDSETDESHCDKDDSSMLRKRKRSPEK